MFAGDTPVKNLSIYIPDSAMQFLDQVTSIVVYQFVYLYPGFRYVVPGSVNIYRGVPVFL